MEKNMSDEPKKPEPSLSFVQTLSLGGLIAGAGVAAVTTGMQTTSKREITRLEEFGAPSADIEALQRKIDLAMKIMLAGMGLALVSTVGFVRSGRKRNEHLIQEWKQESEAPLEGAPTFNALPPEIRSEFSHQLFDSCLCKNFILIDATDPTKEYDLSDPKKYAALLEAFAVAMKPLITLSFEPPSSSQPRAR